MRFLKNKIRLAEEAAQRKQQPLQKSPLSSETSKEEEEISIPSPIVSQGRAKRSCSAYAKPILASSFINPTKNIVINYGKAIFSFAMSDLAKEYIERHFRQEAFDLVKFHEFLTEMKPRISGYKNLEGVFVVDEERDNEEIVLYKKVLKMLGEVFIKYFSVNWIMHGKVFHKMVYLKYRFTILRRVVQA